MAASPMPPARRPALPDPRIPAVGASRPASPHLPDAAPAGAAPRSASPPPATYRSQAPAPSWPQAPAPTPDWQTMPQAWPLWCANPGWSEPCLVVGWVVQGGDRSTARPLVIRDDGVREVRDKLYYGRTREEAIEAAAR